MMERGVKGMLPLGCIPRWGREGVTLIASLKCKKKGEQNDFYGAIIFISFLEYKKNYLIRQEPLRDVNGLFFKIFSQPVPLAGREMRKMR